MHNIRFMTNINDANKFKGHIYVKSLFRHFTLILFALNVKIFRDGPIDELVEQDLPSSILVNGSELWKKLPIKQTIFLS